MKLSSFHLLDRFNVRSFLNIAIRRLGTFIIRNCSWVCCLLNVQIIVFLEPQMKMLRFEVSPLCVGTSGRLLIKNHINCRFPRSLNSQPRREFADVARRARLLLLENKVNNHTIWVASNVLYRCWICALKSGSLEFSFFRQTFSWEGDSGHCKGKSHAWPSVCFLFLTLKSGKFRNLTLFYVIVPFAA